MAIHCGLSFRTIILLIGLYSMCHVVQVAEGRFLWDLTYYCIHYCSRVGEQIPPIGVCSCHRITSYHRRTALNNFQITPEQNSPNYNDE
jgi:hypothetical protein